MDKKQILYFPSFAVGIFSSGIPKKVKVNNIPVRFFSKEMPTEYRHPYFLLTAGHQYKQKNIREEWGLKEDGITVMGDSGGYQIATGALKWNKNIRHEIFEWLENNSDIAMNIDIPTSYQMGTRNHFNNFYECLDISYDNFKYFENNQSGKTKFLNVIHGNNENQISKWYNKVKDFEFSGWSIGGSGNLESMLLKLSLLLKEKEMDKKNNIYIHMLGLSKISDFFILSIIQRELNKLYDNRIQITLDSSSPVRGAAFGTYYYYNDYYNGTFKSLSFSNNEKYNSKRKLPCNCIICNNLTFEAIEKFNTKSYLTIGMHNFLKMTDALKLVNKIIDSDEKILKESINNNLYKILNSIIEIMNSKNPIEKYKTYLPLFKKIKKIDKSSFENFFK